jgi:hypothetical protein
VVADALEERKAASLLEGGVITERVDDRLSAGRST